MGIDTAAALIDSARALGPAIRAARGEIERARRLPPALVAALQAASLFKMYLPAALGGLETDPITSMRVVEEIAAADGAAGWTLMIGSTYGLWAAFLPEAPAREIYGEGDAVVAGALRPSGRARIVPGGVVVDGRWSFASGIQHCRWWNAGCVVHEGDQPRRTSQGDLETCLVFFPAPQGTVIDTWDVGGLRGTGSHDYAVADLFVPDARVIALDASPRERGPLYRLPLQALLDSAMAAVPLGIARTAIDALVELVATKRSAGGSEARLAERHTIQADVGRAEALLQSARAFLYGSVQEAWADVLAGRPVPPRQAALLRLARIHAASASAEAVARMYTAGGGTSVYATGLLERCFRDVHTVTQHVSMAPSNYEVCGRVFLGLEPDRKRV
jgi:alkylation response protein AidB-like acyl-CoA dehydrogenase